MLEKKYDDRLLILWQTSIVNEIKELLEMGNTLHRPQLKQKFNKVLYLNRCFFLKSDKESISSVQVSKLLECSSAQVPKCLSTLSDQVLECISALSVQVPKFPSAISAQVPQCHKRPSALQAPSDCPKLLVPFIVPKFPPSAQASCECPSA